MKDERILSLAREQQAWVSSVRRALHRVPEPGFREEKTKKLICEKLNEIGVAPVCEHGWITAVVDSGEDGPVTGFRADFDALPVTEPQGCPFRSEHEGYMHACGHDLHTAILLGTARLLTAARGEWRGKVKLLFQPAEETVGGAKPMVEGGVMENPRVDRVYGLHVMPRLVTGQVECRPGTLNAGTDGVKLTVKGVGAHGAYPDLGRDAIVCAAQLVTALQTLVSRSVSPLENCVLTLGTIEGGRASNILCDQVVMTGTLRTANRDLRAMMLRRIREVCAGVGQAMNCEIEAELTEGYAPLVNDSAHCERVLATARRLFGAENTLIKDAPSMGAEDFSYFLDCAPGAFFHIGCSADAAHPCAPLHSAEFDPDENCIPVGLTMEAALATGE